MNKKTKPTETAIGHAHAYWDAVVDARLDQESGFESTALPALESMASDDQTLNEGADGDDGSPQADSDSPLGPTFDDWERDHPEDNWYLVDNPAEDQESEPEPTAEELWSAERWEEKLEATVAVDRAEIICDDQPLADDYPARIIFVVREWVREWPEQERLFIAQLLNTLARHIQTDLACRTAPNSSGRRA